MKEEQQYTYELLIDYVDGLLGSESTARVENIVKNDEEAQAIVEGIRTFYDTHGKDRDALEKWLDKGKNKEIMSTKETKVRKLSVWPKIAIAVAAAAIILFAYIGMQDSRHSVACDYAALPVEVEFETRSNDELSKVKAAFDNQDFEKVLVLAEGEFEDSIQLDFMIGVSFFKTADYPMAVAMLDGLEETRLAEYSLWYTALSYAMTEQNDRAERAMNTVVETKGKYAADAQKWLAIPQD
jgi:hypothetical protein